jgi:hypothetical protein
VLAETVLAMYPELAECWRFSAGLCKPSKIKLGKFFLATFVSGPTYKAEKKVWKETDIFDDLARFLDQDVWEDQSGRYDRQQEESAQQEVRLLSFSRTSTPGTNLLHSESPNSEHDAAAVLQSFCSSSRTHTQFVDS